MNWDYKLLTVYITPWTVLVFFLYVLLIMMVVILSYKKCRFYKRERLKAEVKDVIQEEIEKAIRGNDYP